MEKNWYSRLLEVIEADKRSYKKLSAEIGSRALCRREPTIRAGRAAWPGWDRLDDIYVAALRNKRAQGVMA